MKLFNLLVFRILIVFVLIKISPPAVKASVVNPVFIDVPEGLKYGINYHPEDATKATLVLLAPNKGDIHAVGDFTLWKVLVTHKMNKDSDGETYWLEVKGLTAGKEYIFQYWIGNDIKVGDPYARKIADPWNDINIPEEVYPDLPSYSFKDFGLASVLQTGQEEFQWSASEDSWTRPDINHLVIYELHLRDFLKTSSYKELIDTLSYIKGLGVEAIELMPINEFEGNDSWGYNPSYYFATDKYYGKPDDLKRFIEAAHQNGLAVIMDIVLNHAFGQSPMVQMYFNKSANRPASDSPWFNAEYVGPFEWGYDFNHESKYTEAFIDQVNKYWIEAFHFDGFRFDFTKGFTNSAPNNSLDAYDASRIAIVKRMASEIWKTDQEAYVILEHFGSSEEEKELSDYGCKLWRNRSYDYVPSMNGDPSKTFIGMDSKSHISYFNSHDERRLAEHALTEGREMLGYDIRDTSIMLERIKMAAAFTYLFPGPKMIWQFDELAYDVNIDFNGRVGRKPLPWGPASLGYYDNELRQHVYTAYSAILAVRNTITPQLLDKSNIRHKLSGNVRRLVFDTEGIDLVVIGNFGIEKESLNPEFTQTGTWYNYFSGESTEIIDRTSPIELQPGEWHIFTTVKLSEGLEGVVETYKNPVVISPYPFKINEQITITFDATLASKDGTNGLIGSNKVYLHSGVVLNPSGKNLSFIQGSLTDDGLGQMTKVAGEENKWQISLTPSSYYGISNTEEAFRLGMYFRDGDNSNRGKGFRNENIYFNVAEDQDFISISPLPFDANTEITITYNANKGNRELAGINKVYMHSGMSVVNTESPQNNAWNNAVGNWGQDDGLGKMERVAGENDLWQIKLVPKDYYNLSSNDQPTWLAAVFRSPDGNKKGTGTAGPIANGFIHTNLDFFIRNAALVSTIDENQLPHEIYPNPSLGLIDFSNFKGRLEITIYDISGRKMLRETRNSEKIIDLGHFPKGLYLYKVASPFGHKSGRIILK